MINKQNLWFITLFSLILVLSVYYITMPNELLLNNNSNSYLKNDSSSDDSKKENSAKKQTGSNKDDKTKEAAANAEVEDSNVLEALRVNKEEERSSKKAELQKELTDNKKTTDEKNEAYEKLKELNTVSGREEKLESKLKEELKLDSFIEIDGNKVIVTIDKKDHNVELASKIMKTIEKEFNDKVYISVKFGK